MKADNQTFQEGGGVVVVKSIAQPEPHQTAHTSHLGGTNDRGSVQGVHLNTNKKFWHETNPIIRPTHQFITEALNYQKRFTDQPDQPYLGSYESNYERASTKAVCYVKEEYLGVQIKKNQARNPNQPEDLVY